MNRKNARDPQAPVGWAGQGRHAHCQVKQDTRWGRPSLAARFGLWTDILTPEELARLLADLEETVPPPDWAERLDEALRESRANYRLMQQWLDRQGTEEHL